MERQLEREADEQWAAKPAVERLRHAGLFWKEEDMAVQLMSQHDHKCEAALI